MANDGGAQNDSNAVDIELSMKNVDPKLIKHANDADEAMKAFEDMQGEAIELDEETNRRLLRTIDWHIMPVMCCVYGMNFLDSEYSYSTLAMQFSTDDFDRNYVVLC